MARHVVSSSAPPCVLGTYRKDKCECLVATVEGGERTEAILSELARALIVASTGAYATASVSDRVNNTYFLVVAGGVATTTAASANLRARVEQMPGCGRVTSVEQLNRRLQARLGWGDVRLGELAQPELAQPSLMDALDAELIRDGLPHTVFWQHPTRGGRFPVLDPPKPNDDEKLAWLRQELRGGDVGLIDFARKYLELFRANVHTEAVQKMSALRLYKAYAGAPWGKECDLPPALLTDFQQLWNPEAPERCRECGKALVGAWPILHKFCSDTCEKAGIVTACRYCGSAASLTETEGYFYCTACKRGSPLRKRANRPVGDDRTDLDKLLDNQREQLKMVSRLWGTVSTVSPDHEPAWKRRRRS